MIYSDPSMALNALVVSLPSRNGPLLLRKRFTKEAFDYGFLTYPRGLLMAGVPGCGKSAIAKAIANEWNMNLLTVKADRPQGVISR